MDFAIRADNGVKMRERRKSTERTKKKKVEEDDTDNICNWRVWND